MVFNYSKLNGRIVERFGSQAKFAEAMGISEHSISQKVNNKTTWKNTEIHKACGLLEISNADVWEYFFNRQVQVS